MGHTRTHPNSYRHLAGPTWPSHTQTGQHALTFTLTLRHGHQGLSRSGFTLSTSVKMNVSALAQREEKEKMEVNVSASKREGKDIEQGCRPELPALTPLPRA